MFFVNSCVLTGLEPSGVQKRAITYLPRMRILNVAHRKRLVRSNARFLSVSCSNREEHSGQHSQWNDEDTDYFGRDPRKETEFWMEHAREVLESKEVTEAVEAHKKSGKENLTEEQRAWLEFARSITPPNENNN